MGLYKRGSTWWFTVTYNQNRIQQSTGTENKRKAELIYAKAKADIIDNKWLPDVHEEKTTEVIFEELAQRYLQWIEARQRSADRKTRAIRLLRRRFGQEKLSSFSTHIIEQYQGEMIKSGNANSTVNRYVATVKHMFTKAFDWVLIDETVLKKVRKAQMLTENNRRLRFLTKEECIKLIECCSEHLRPIVTLALNTGMRKGEILSLKWEDVDLKHKFILLSMTKNNEKREIPNKSDSQGGFWLNKTEA